MKKKFIVAILLSSFLMPNVKALTEGFNDVNFHACVASAAGQSSSDNLTSEQLQGITELNCENKGIKDVAGLEKLTKLVKLNLDNNDIKTINLESNTLLDNIQISFNLLDELNLSKNTVLKELNASNNNLKSIDLSNNNLLQVLNLWNNEISNISVTNLNQLTTLNLSTNSISAIDLKSNTLLEKLYISGNNLEDLDLSKNVALKEIDVALNKKDIFDFSNNNNLQIITLSYNGALNGDFTQLKALNKIELVDYKIIPVYGNVFKVADLLNYVPSEIKANDYQFYEVNIVNYGSVANRYTEEYINANINNYSLLKLYSGNIESNIKVNDNVSYSFSGYYEQRYNKTTSDKYNVDEEEGTINVGSDSDEEILENLKTTWDGTIYKITGDKLVVSYNNFDYKEEKKK